MLSARTRQLSRGRAFRIDFRKHNARNGTLPEPRLRTILFAFKTRHLVAIRNERKIKKAPLRKGRGAFCRAKKALGIDRRLIHARQLSVAASHEFEHDGGLDGIMKRIESQMPRNVIAVRLLKSRADGSDVEGSRF